MKIVVLGGNAAGMSFAAKYKRNAPNHEVIVIEQRRYLSFGGCGLPYFAGGMFDDTSTMISRTPEQAIASGLDVRIETQAIALDKVQKKVTLQPKEAGKDSYQLDYDRLIIATGARPIVPDFGDYDPSQVHTLTNLDDGLALKAAFANPSNQHICIIGGGFIGLEVLDAAHELGKNITLIEREARLLSKQFSQEIMTDVETAIIEAGIKLKTQTQVQSITDASDQNNAAKQHNAKPGYHIHTDKGQVLADIVILALGFRPNTECFELEKADNGALLVDEFGATSDPFIYAVGDCALVHHLTLEQATYLPLATTANKQARMMADKLCGKPTHLSGFLGSSCLKVLDYELACTGLSESMATHHGLEVKISLIKDKNQTDYYPGQEDIQIKLVYQPKTKRLLGGEAVGKKGAVGRVNALAVAITAGMTTEQLGYLDFCYSPPFARTWDALNVAGNVAK